MGFPVHSYNKFLEIFCKGFHWCFKEDHHQLGIKGNCHLVAIKGGCHYGNEPDCGYLLKVITIAMVETTTAYLH